MRQNMGQIQRLDKKKIESLPLVFEHKYPLRTVHLLAKGIRVTERASKCQWLEIRFSRRVSNINPTISPEMRR